MTRQQERIIAEFKKHGYYYDDIDSYNEWIRFFHEYGVISFESWKNAKEWIENVVFD